MTRHLLGALACAVVLAGPARATDPVPPLPEVNLSFVCRETGACDPPPDCLDLDCNWIPHQTCVDESMTQYHSCLPTGDNFPYDVVDAVEQQIPVIVWP